jgi:hypothetical protein
MFKHLESILDMHGVEVCANYDDWQDGPLVEERLSIGEIAAFKARELYALTGLPSVAERTSVTSYVIAVTHRSVLLSLVQFPSNGERNTLESESTRSFHGHSLVS